MYVLKDLWNGDISILERLSPKDSSFKELRAEGHELETKLRNELTETGKEIYEEFFSNLMAQNSEWECAAFIDGFRLGAQIILDVVGDER